MVLRSSAEGLALLKVNNLVNPMLTSLATSEKYFDLFNAASKQHITLGPYAYY